MSKSDKTRILIVEDLPSDAELVMREALKELPDAEFRHVETEPDFLRELVEFKPDLILSDYSMPRFNGLRALKLSLEYDSTVPVIIVTGSINEDTAVDCMKAGAANYVIKDQMKRLGPAIRHALEEKKLELEKIQAQQFLLQSEERFRLMIEGAPDPIFIQTNQKFAYLNSQALYLLGAKHESELLGKSVFEVFHPSFAEIIRDRNYQLNVNKQNVSALEQIYIRLDGTQVWVETSGVPIEFGGENGALIFARDVSQRRKTDEELRISREKFMALFANNPAGLYRTSIDDEVMDANPALLKMLGFDNIEQLKSRRVHEGYVEKEEKDLFDQTIIENGRFSGITRWFKSDGNIIWLEEQAVAIKDDNGKTLYFDGSVIDVTEKKLAQDFLKESEEKYRLVADNSADVIFIVDNQFRYTFISPSVEKLRGFTPEEMLRSTIDANITHDSFERVKKAIAQQKQFEAEGLIEKNSNYILELEMFHKNGHTIWAEVKASFLRNSNSEIVGIMGITRDISERKVAEENIKEKNRLLLAINQYAKEISQTAYSDLFSFVVNKLKAISGSSVAILNIFDENTNELVCKKTTLTNEESGVVEKMLGARIEGFRTPVSPEMLARIKQEVIGKADNLLTLTFGKIPKALGNIIMGATRYKWFLGISLTKDEKLVGTILLGGKKGDKPINSEEFLAFAGVTANAISRAQAEEKLKASEEKYRIIAENTADTITILDFKFRYLYSSPSISRMLGYSVDEILQLEPQQITHPNSIEIITQVMREEMRAEMSGLADPNRNRTVLLKQFHKNGSIRWIESTASFIRDEMGKPLSILAISRDVTTRIIEAELLAKSQEEFKAIFENNSAAIAIIEPDSTISKVNEAFCEISGYSIEESVGISWTKLIHERDLARINEYNQRRLINPHDAPAKYEFLFYRKDGTIRFVLMSVAVIPSSKKIVASFSDITERRQAEIDIQKKEEKYRNLLEFAPDAFFQSDIKGNFILVNNKAAELTGYSKEELQMMNMSELFEPKTLSEKPLCYDLLNVGETVKNEREMLTKNGRKIFIEISTHAMDDGTYQCFIRDVSERKQAEEDLRESEERFKALHNASFGGIAIHDNGLILECNHGLTEISGYSFGELIGMDGLLLISDATRDIVKNNIRNNYFQQYEAIGVRKNGEEYALRLEARAIPYKGKMVRSVEFRDITEQKKLQQLLIDQQIQQRKIVEEELAKTKDALVRSTRLAAVGQISATIAHDLRNPLGAVRNAAYYLKRKLIDSDPKVLNYFSIIDSEVETADKIISNLLQMSKVKEPEKAHNDLRDVIALATGSQYAKLEVEILVDLDQEPFVLLTDKVQIVQLMRNLLENSSHTGVENIVVNIKGVHVEDGVELIFCDNGPGISDEVRESLFEPLITTKAKGTGLGLTICKQIVEKHGGSISLIEKPEMGACFKIVLPLK